MVETPGRFRADHGRAVNLPDQSWLRILTRRPNEPRAPGFGGRAVFDGDAPAPHVPIDIIEVIDLDREIGHGGPGAAFGRDAHLWGRGRIGREGHNPAEIHDDVHPENAAIERIGGLDVRSADVRHDAFHSHVFLHSGNLMRPLVFARRIAYHVNTPYMTLSIRNPEADALAKRLAKLEDTTITEAVVVVLREAIAARTRCEEALAGAGAAWTSPLAAWGRSSSSPAPTSSTAASRRPRARSSSGWRRAT